MPVAALVTIAMTVFMHDGRTSEGTELLDDWNISDSELLNALPETASQELVQQHNDLAETHEHVSTVKSVETLAEVDAPVHDLIQHHTACDLCETAVDALHERDEMYIVSVEKTSLSDFYTVSLTDE
jgi:hypothetical protein